MISKSQRRNVHSVERLSQAGFNAAKGIDITASVLSPNTVIYTKNLEIQADGSLELRKPISHVRDFYEFYKMNSDTNCLEIVPSKVKKVHYLFDNNYYLIIREVKVPSTETDPEYSGLALAIVDVENNTPVSFNITYDTWDEYRTKSISLDTSNYGGYLLLTDFDLSGVEFANTATSTVISNGLVNLNSNIFFDIDETYPDGSNAIHLTNLYDYKYSLGVYTLFKPRTLIVSKSTAFSVKFDIKIVTPDINKISTSDDVVLNINLDLDNPYAIRDEYVSSAPSFKNIIAYVPTENIAGNVVPNFTDNPYLSATSDSSTEIVNPTYTPDEINLDSWNPAICVNLHNVDSYSGLGVKVLISSRAQLYRNTSAVWIYYQFCMWIRLEGQLGNSYYVRISAPDYRFGDWNEPSTYTREYFTTSEGYEYLLSESAYIPIKVDRSSELPYTPSDLVNAVRSMSPLTVAEIFNYYLFKRDSTHVDDVYISSDVHGLNLGPYTMNVCAYPKELDPSQTDEASTGLSAHLTGRYFSKTTSGEYVENSFLKVIVSKWGE